MVVSSVLLYKEGVRSVEADLRSGVERDAKGIAREIEMALRESEAALAALARSTAMRNYVASNESTSGDSARSSAQQSPGINNSQTDRTLPLELKESIRGFILSNPTRYGSILCLGTAEQRLFRAELVARRSGTSGAEAVPDVDFKTENLLAVPPDPRVWNSSDYKPLRSPISREPNGATLRYSVPVFAGDPGPEKPRGVLIVELDADIIIDGAVTGRTGEGTDSEGASDPSSAQRTIVLVDRAGYVLFHTNKNLRYQNVDAVLPELKNISRAMIGGESGWSYFDETGSRWLIAYRQVEPLGVSVGVAGNYTLATRSLNRLDWFAIILFSLFGLLTVIVFTHVLRNTARSIERVTEGAVAIAGGQLEQRIEVRSNDETRLLAESFNIMTDRLREQIARETESRQFESFMRLSAMMTHDLKNAIAGLSLLVGNMERQFHREEFRADAMKSLTEAADKLRRLVAKLSEPVQSLSSEHQMARPVDLVPIIRNAINATVEPARALHQIEVDLPDSLFATVEADRIERVFENLIINGIEAMGAKSGKLTIKAGEAKQGEVFVAVSDTGTGMSEEFQRVKLFRPFSTTKKSGIGLGLYTCREIVNAHGGHIEVESKRGSGATFRVVLPSQSRITGTRMSR